MAYRQPRRRILSESKRHLRRLTRIILFLDSFNYVVEHILGKINPTNPIELDPTTLFYRLDGLAEVIIIDECCKVPTKTLKAILNYLSRRTCQVICAGDRGQVPPWGNKEGPHAMLEEWAVPSAISTPTTHVSCEVCLWTSRIRAM